MLTAAKTTLPTRWSRVSQTFSYPLPTYFLNGSKLIHTEYDLLRTSTLDASRNLSDLTDYFALKVNILQLSIGLTMMFCRCYILKIRKNRIFISIDIRNIFLFINVLGINI